MSYDELTTRVHDALQSYGEEGVMVDDLCEQNDFKAFDRCAIREALEKLKKGGKIQGTDPVYGRRPT